MNKILKALLKLPTQQWLNTYEMLFALFKTEKDPFIFWLTKYCVEKKNASSNVINPNIPAIIIDTKPKNWFPESA